jgi:O-antigen/teichoic acid export membrane protein
LGASSPPAAARAAPASSSYGRGARILSVGIATTGLVTFAYFAVASHVLDGVDYKGISLLWSVLFVVVSVIYRPIEQLLSRSIAERRALGHAVHSLRVPMVLQGAFALAFLVVALALRGPLVDDVFDGSQALYWVLVASVLAYAASYFARGWLAGNQRFGLYGGLVLVESISRVLFPVAVAIGILEGQSAVALGILAAPFVSLVVVPPALRRQARAGHGAGAPGRAAGQAAAPGGPTLRQGGGFAVAVFAVMLAEQTIINAPVLIADATAADAALAGFVFNVLLIARAPLQLFQAVQTSLLPHLASLNATAGRHEFAHAVRITLVAIAGFAGLCALGLLAIGPFVMDVLFGGAFDYGRVGLAIVALGMGCHLAAGTLNQAALARGRQRAAAFAWAGAALVLVAWLAVPIVDDVLLRVQVGYLGATALLCTALALIDRRL